MSIPSNPEKQDAKIARLKEETARLKRENRDLKTMLETSSAHSDRIAEGLLNDVESTRRESDRRFRLISETIPVPLVVSRVSDNAVVYANPPAGSLLGISENELPGHKIVDFYDPPFGERLLSLVKREGGVSRFELSGRDYFDTPFYAALSVRPLPFGEVPCLLSVLHDLTERKQAEVEMERLRNYLKSILDSMPSILVGVDKRCRITQWNRKAEKTTGVSERLALGKTFSELFPGFKKEMDMIRKVIDRGEILREKKVLGESDTRVSHSELTVYPLMFHGEAGAVIRLDDITERVRMEELVIQSEKMLSTAGLAAGMAHEINTPLSGILQNLQVVKSRMSEGLSRNRAAAEACGTNMEAVADYMEKRGVFGMIDAIMRSGDRAASIVNNMLSFSHQGESSKRPCDIPGLMDRTIELASADYDLEKSYDFRQIRILRDYEPDLPPLHCEPGKLQQVFLNLLKNGAQAMAGAMDPLGAPCFHIRIYLGERVLCIEVADNGPGIDASLQRRIFEPFFTTKPPGEGTGLGLSAAGFIIGENHGGTLEVASAPGKGARFIIQLPLEERGVSRQPRGKGMP